MLNEIENIEIDLQGIGPRANGQTWQVSQEFVIAPGEIQSETLEFDANDLNWARITWNNSDFNLYAPGQCSPGRNELTGWPRDFARQAATEQIKIGCRAIARGLVSLARSFVP